MLPPLIAKILQNIKPFAPTAEVNFTTCNMSAHILKTSLRELMEKYGFVTIATECSWLDDDRTIEGRIKNTYHWFKDKFGRGKKLPNLTYIGQKQ